MPVQTRPILVEYLKKNKLSPEAAERVLDLAFSSIRTCLLRYKIVVIENICTLYLEERKATRKRVPRGIGLIKIPKQYTIHIKTNKNFREILKKIQPPLPTKK